MHSYTGSKHVNNAVYMTLSSLWLFWFAIVAIGNSENN